MLKDLVTNKNYLSNLFTEKDFNFINNFDREISKINSQIEKQEKTNESISMTIDELASLTKIQEVAANQGLSYNNNNIRTITEDK